MDDAHQLDKRIEPVKDRLTDDLVGADGEPADPAVVEQTVESVAAPYAEAPLQEFVPLLVEHDARDELRQQGLRRGELEADTGEATGNGDEGDRHETVHLTGHQGLTPQSD